MKNRILLALGVVSLISFGIGKAYAGGSKPAHLDQDQANLTQQKRTQDVLYQMSQDPQSWFHLIPRDITNLVQDYLPELKLVTVIEAIMNKFGPFISLKGLHRKHSKDSISPVGVSQELWVKVMGNNPSYHKKKDHCPGKDPSGQDEHQIVTIDGNKIEMCTHFPAEMIAAESKSKKDSDEEFIAQLNKIYESARSKTRFRRHKAVEFEYADTNGGLEKKNLAQILTNTFMPYDDYWPRSFWQNKENSLGFRRSGVWEWVEDINGSDRGLVGGSWYGIPVFAVSGYRYSNWPNYRYGDIGPARLVRTDP